jgi:SAM-dependent MidA family methyltransferase
MPDTPLAHIIREEIARAPIPFRRFMELALYHPAHGYYTSGRAQVGRKGDFFTNVSVGSLYGRLMARQFVEVWQRLGEPAEFTIVEQGANTGDFAADALGGLRALNSACFDATRYRIVEPAPALAAKQREKLAPFSGRVEWCESEAALPAWTGVHFSNELVDAFPVHVVKWTGAEWLERHVENGPEGFQFVDLAPSSPRLAAACAKLPPRLEGTITEINLAAEDWISATAAKMERGCILAVDYGWEREEYHAPTRTTGTLSAYANHKREENPLARPGEIDLTAHVNFSDLADAALACGLQVAGFTDQHHFMVGPGEHHFADGANAEDVRAFKTLMHPQFMGLAFKVIAFAKALPGGPLTGFRYARKSAIG